MTTVRRAGATSVATLSGLVLVLGLSHGLAPEWAKRVGLDVWNLSTESDSLRASDAEDAVLEQQREQLHREIELADHVAASVAEGTLTLTQAVAELEPILRQRRGYSCYVELRRSPSFRHEVACYVIQRVTRLLKDDPSRQAVALKRLTTEYATFH